MKPTEIALAIKNHPNWGDGEWQKQITQALIPFTGQEVIVSIIVSIRPKTEKRSNPQNAYYHGVVVKMVREALLKQPTIDKDVLTPDNVHRILKHACGVSHSIVIERIVLSPHDPVPIEQYYIEGRTKTMTTKQFQDYIIQCQEWSARILGIIIPDPVEPGYHDWLESVIARENEQSEMACNS